MMELRLEPNISSCIETVAKREYNKVLGMLLKGEQEDKELLEALELLRLFLESADFRKLRSASEGFLLNGRRVAFLLKSSSGTPGYEIEINQV